MGAPSTVELCFDDTAELERHWREHLSRGGAWIAGSVLDRDATCSLVLMVPGGGRLELPARVVFADGSGAGLALDGFGPEMREQIEALMKAAIEHEHEHDGDDDDAPLRDPIAHNVHERLRRLNPVEQHKVARDGETHERVVLERLYGKAVWAPLLGNPRLTHPEVARIARMGALPRPLLELIVGNAAWLKAPEVRRALLANRRLAVDQIPRVLRLLPKHELKLVPSQTAYPIAVRDAARRMLSGLPDKT